MKLDQNRRRFLRDLSKLSVGATLGLLPKEVQHSLEPIHLHFPEDAKNDEVFWKGIRKAYDLPKKLINLNNGGVSPHPIVVRKALEEYHQFSNQAPSYFMWKKLDKNREHLRQELAALIKVESENIAINRNSTEALETVIFGLDLVPGDEVILSKQDYPNMIHAWKQRSLRDKIRLKWVDLDLPSEDKDYLVSSYQSQITSKTKVIHLTHVLNWNGQIMPAKEIIQMAHHHGLEVVLDAAHSFAQFDFDVNDIDCDYLGSSLHKWLGAPFGTGLLYVKKNKIANLYPLFGSPEPTSGDIRKFEHLGTRSFAIEQAIQHAINFHKLIGQPRKFDRLFFLKEYWMKALSDDEDFILKTSRNKKFSGAIGLFSIRGVDNSRVYKELIDKYQIHTSPSNWNGIEGIRISPNLYTSTKDLDKLVTAIMEIKDQFV